MQVDFSITESREQFEQYEKVKINYSHERFITDCITIRNGNLLFENGVAPQSINCFEYHGYTAFYKKTDSDIAFDLFAASFYLVSRYEEYLPHQKDMYGRYSHENSLAFKEGFLQLPLINIWVNDLIKIIQQKFPFFKILSPAFSFSPTYDIDMAFAYRHKGWLRNVGGFVKSPSLDRIKVLLGKAKDPFDVYDWLDQLHQQYALQPLYFFLLAEKNCRYDKNIATGKKAMQQLIEDHATKYMIGIHPSWQSGDDEKLLFSEKATLEKISHQTITNSRQHYIRFNLPEGYQRLIAAGITGDYSMGYGSINGFRASIAADFYWYDLVNEQETSLRIHPFCFMDANAFYEQHLSPQQAYNELIQYYETCKKAGGKLSIIWHNNFLGSHLLFAGWRRCYQEFIHLLAK